MTVEEHPASALAADLHSHSTISDGVLSPRELVIRHKLTFSKHCKGVFGLFCHAHDEPSPTNSMVSRTSPAILLGPTGNLQGTYKLLNLNTGAKIKRRKWSPSPMSDSVIRQVERMGDR